MSDDLSSNPGTYMVEAENWIPQIVLWPPHAHSYTNTSFVYIHKMIIKYNKNLNRKLDMGTHAFNLST